MSRTVRTVAYIALGLLVLLIVWLAIWVLS
jgi:hypothetical protein